MLSKHAAANKRSVANYQNEIKNNKARFETLHNMKFTNIAFCNNNRAIVEDLLENAKVGNEKFFIVKEKQEEIIKTIFMLPQI